MHYWENVSEDTEADIFSHFHTFSDCTYNSSYCTFLPIRESKVDLPKQKFDVSWNSPALGKNRLLAATYLCYIPVFFFPYILPFHRAFVMFENFLDDYSYFFLVVPLCDNGEYTVKVSGQVYTPSNCISRTEGSRSAGVRPGCRTQCRWSGADWHRVTSSECLHIPAWPFAKLWTKTLE